MLALIAGTGALPAALIWRLGTYPVVCALAGNGPDIDVEISFRIEHLGRFLKVLQDRGVTEICMAGAITRPLIDPSEIDAATLPLVPRIQAAIARGDDGALREVISIFEDHGFAVKSAHEIAPDLLPDTGVTTNAVPSDWHKADAKVGEAKIAQMGASDIGQACIVRVGRVMASEDATGTDAMLADFHVDYLKSQPDGLIDSLVSSASDLFENITDAIAGTDVDPVTADDGILFKAPKPNQDRRADLPVIGFDTAMNAAEAGLAGIVIEAGGVMVIDIEGVVETLNAQGMFLWVRQRGSA